MVDLGTWITPCTRHSLAQLDLLPKRIQILLIWLSLKACTARILELISSLLCLQLESWPTSLAALIPMKNIRCIFSHLSSLAHQINLNRQILLNGIRSSMGMLLATFWR